MDRHHIPKGKSPTPFLECHDKDRRIQEIRSYKGLSKAALEVWRKMKSGVMNVIFPHGAYLPGMPNLVRLTVSRIGVNTERRILTRILI